MKREPKVKYNSIQEAQLAKEQYKQLSNHPAWKLIQKFYDRKIDFHTDELKSKDITTIDQLERIRDKIRLCTQMRNLPEILSTQIEMNEEEEQMNFDPFV